MDFEFSEEQIAIRDTIRELVQDKVAPRAAEIDERSEYPKDIEKLFAENGILGIPFPEQYGGLGADLLTTCLAIEALTAGVVEVEPVVAELLVELLLPHPVSATMTKTGAANATTNFLI